MIPELVKLFFLFAKLSAFAFGGGYVMIPGMLSAAASNNWATPGELSDIIAIAGMSPGPVAINSAIGLGYKVAGIPGAVAAFTGIAFPTVLIVGVSAVFFLKNYRNTHVQRILTGLRPVVVGITLFAAVKLAIDNKLINFGPVEKFIGGIFIDISDLFSLELKSIFIAIIAFILMSKTKVKPIFIILASAITGMIIFSI